MVRIKTHKVKIYMYQYFKRQLKTPTCFGAKLIRLKSTCINILKDKNSDMFRIKTHKVKIYMHQYFKRQLKTPTCFGSSGIHP